MVAVGEGWEVEAGELTEGASTEVGSWGETVAAVGGEGVGVLTAVRADGEASREATEVVALVVVPMVAVAMAGSLAVQAAARVVAAAAASERDLVQRVEAAAMMAAGKAAVARAAVKAARTAAETEGKEGRSEVEIAVGSLGGRVVMAAAPAAAAEEGRLVAKRAEVSPEVGRRAAAAVEEVAEAGRLEGQAVAPAAAGKDTRPSLHNRRNRYRKRDTRCSPPRCRL